MRVRQSEAKWCACGLEAYVHCGEDILCPFCYLSRLRDIVRDTCKDAGALASLDRSEALLRMRRAEEELRLVSIVHGRIQA